MTHANPMDYELTPPQKRFLKALGHCRHATTDLIHRWTGLHSSDVRRELPGLLDQGLILEGRAQRGLRVVWLSREGSMSVGLRPRHKDTFARALVRHDLAVGEFMLDYINEGHEVEASPWIMQRFDDDFDDAILSRPARPTRVNGGWHTYRETAPPRRQVRNLIPDFTVYPSDAPSHAIAVEVELTRKPPEDIRDKLLRFHHTQMWQSVLYLTDDPAVTRLIERGIEKTRTGAFIEVQQVTLPDYLVGWKPISRKK